MNIAGYQHDASANASQQFRGVQSIFACVGGLVIHQNPLCRYSVQDKKIFHSLRRALPADDDFFIGMFPVIDHSHETPPISADVHHTGIRLRGAHDHQNIALVIGPRTFQPRRVPADARGECHQQEKEPREGQNPDGGAVESPSGIAVHMSGLEYTRLIR